MARARNIKPGFFVNDDLGECEPLARLLFAGLWTIADREGRLEYRPKRIKAEILPYDDCDVADLLESLASKGFIAIYEVGGNQYIQVHNWKKHQNPHVKEGASTIPAQGYDDTSTAQAPDKHHTSTVQEQEQHRTCPADSLNLIPDILIPDTTTPTPISNYRVENDEDGRGGDQVITLYQGEIGQITGLIAESITADRQQYGDEWVCRAIGVAAKAGRRSYSYVHGVLSRWWSEGYRAHDSPWEKRQRGKAEQGGETDLQKWYQEQEEALASG